MASIKKEKHLWLALLIGFILMLVFMLPRLMDPYSLEKDFINWYWMHLFQEGDLFPNDYFIERHIMEVAVGPATLFIYKASPLYGLLYQLLSNFIPIILLGKLQVFPLALIAIYYLYRISQRFVSPTAAMTICLLFVLLNLILPSLVSVTGGFQRSFVLPLLLAFLYYGWQERYRYAAVVLLLAGGLYPPLLLLLLVACFLELALSGWAARHTPEGRQYRLYLGGLLLLGVIVSLLLWPMIKELLGQTLTFDIRGNWASLSESGTYGLGGRSSLFYIFPFVGRGGIADHGMTIIIVMFLAIFAGLIYAWQPQRLRDFPRVFKSLFWASWITFALAWSGFFLTASFPLYLPSRYTQSSLLLILFIFVMIHAPDALQAAARWVTANTASLHWLSLPVAALLVALFFLLPEPVDNVMAFGRGASRWLFLILAVLLLSLSALIGRRPKAKPSLVSPLPFDSRTQSIMAGSLILMGITVVGALQPFMDYTYHEVNDSHQKMYTYIQTLPKDILLSGSPGPSNPIPMFGKRQVFLTLESLAPDDTAVIDALLAYYADDPVDLLNFCTKYGVDYLVVDTQDFANTGEAGRIYFYEPYNSVITPIIKQRSTFILDTLPDSAKSFQQDNLYIAACTEDNIRK